MNVSSSISFNVLKKKTFEKVSHAFYDYRN